jgi:NADPH:quinone reductase-like Zn-dependent oxidoreductase
MQGMTAQHLCYEAAPVATDAVVLVHSAGSGVGRMLTQLSAHSETHVGACEMLVMLIEQVAREVIRARGTTGYTRYR